MNNQTGQSAYTLVEVTVAAALGTLVMALVLAMLIKNTTGWRDNLARLNLSLQSRLVRERILHGIDGKYGLRNARRSTLKYDLTDIILTDPGMTNSIRLSFPVGKTPVWVAGDTTNLLAPANIKVEEVGLLLQKNIFEIRLALSQSNARKKHTQLQFIRVYLLNE